MAALSPGPHDPARTQRRPALHPTQHHGAARRARGGWVRRPPATPDRSPREHGQPYRAGQLDGGGSGRRAPRGCQLPVRWRAADRPRHLRGHHGPGPRETASDRRGAAALRLTPLTAHVGGSTLRVEPLDRLVHPVAAFGSRGATSVLDPFTSTDVITSPAKDIAAPAWEASTRSRDRCQPCRRTRHYRGHLPLAPPRRLLRKPSF